MWEGVESQSSLLLSAATLLLLFLWCWWWVAATAAKSLQSRLTLPPYRWQPTRLPRPWDSSGKNTGVGSHFLLQCMKVKSESEVSQSCPTRRDPMDCSPPGSMGFSRQECWSGVPLLHNYNPQMRKWLGWVVIHGSSHFVLPYPFPWLPAILWDCDRKVHPSFSFWRLGCRGQVLWSFWGQLGTERRFFFSVYIKISSIEFEIHCEMQHTRLLHLL